MLIKTQEISRCRNVVFEEMPEDLRKVALVFDEHERKRSRGNLMIAYVEGTKIREVIEKESVYGSQAVEMLAKYLNRNASQLYTLKTYASEYSKEDIEKLSTTQMENGEYLSYAHLTALMMIKAEKDRAATLTRVLNESLSATDLALEIAAKSTPKESKKGAKVKKPASANAALAQVQKQTSRMKKRFPGWMEAINALSDIEPGKINSSVGENFKSAMDGLISAADGCMEMANLMKPIAERIRRVIALAAEKAAKPGVSKLRRGEALAMPLKGEQMAEGFAAIDATDTRSDQGDGLDTGAGTDLGEPSDEPLKEAGEFEEEPQPAAAELADENESAGGGDDDGTVDKPAPVDQGNDITTTMIKPERYRAVAIPRAARPRK